MLWRKYSQASEYPYGTDLVVPAPRSTRSKKDVKSSRLYENGLHVPIHPNYAAKHYITFPIRQLELKTKAVLETPAGSEEAA